MLGLIRVDGKFSPKGCFRKLSPILCTEASRGDLGDWRCETSYQDQQHGLWGLMQKEKGGPPVQTLGRLWRQRRH